MWTEVSFDLPSRTWSLWRFFMSFKCMKDKIHQSWALLFGTIQWRIQDFPEEGAPTLRGGYQHTILPKTAWNWKNLNPQGGASKILLCRSATAIFWEGFSVQDELWSDDSKHKKIQIRPSKNYEELPDSKVEVFAVKTGQLNARHLKWKTRLQMKYLHELAVWEFCIE